MNSPLRRCAKLFSIFALALDTAAETLEPPRAADPPPPASPGHDFGWALAELWKGHKVRRANWKPSEYLTLGSDHGELVFFLNDPQTPDKRAEWGRPTHNQLLAHDWARVGLVPVL